MALQEKYQGVVDLMNQLGGRNVQGREENGKFVLTGVVPSASEKMQVWDRIKSIGGDSPSDIMADITMDNSGSGEASGGVSSGGGTYTVQSGDTLSKIAKEYYGDAGKYMDIFNANRDILSDPDKINVGQELKIP